MACCLPTAMQRQVQEHQETEQTVKSICHEDDKHFVVNTHALHNVTLLHKFLPCNLTAPKPLYNDCEAKHHEIAAKLQVTQAEKCARTAAKQKATQDAKKKALHAVVDERELEEDEVDGECGDLHDPLTASEIVQGAGAQKQYCVQQ